MTADDAEARARIRMFFPPAAVVLVSIPLIFRLIPRNSLHGFRTAETLMSDAVWYPANQVAGIALVGAGLIWIAAAIYAPRRYVHSIGVASVLVAVALLSRYF